MKKKSNLKSLDQFVDEQYGKKGASKRDKFEKGYEEFKLGILLQQARLKKGMTQEELAGMVGASRERVNKAIASFIKLHWLEQRDRSYRILEREKLSQRAL